MHRLLTIAALVLSFGISSAEAAKRVALVIGNNSYKTLPDLDNARKDADGIASKLRSLGWDVVLKKDLSQRQAYRQIATFESKLRDAEVGLVYYAGHGIQKDGKNYLIPSDAEIEVEEDLRSEAFTSSDILEAMEKAGAPMNIVILDSCRDNPLPRRSRSAERGLAAPSLPAGIKGTAIVFSAGPGQVAMDGPKNGHGVFTGELLKVLDRPGLKLEEVFKQTARQVAVRTNSKQKPWMNSSVTSDFYFQEEKATPAASAPAADKEAMFWQSIEDSQNPASFEAYLSQYPKGAFASLAKVKIGELRQTKTASLSPQSYTIEAMDETLVALRSANVRERPTASSAKVATLKSGSAVEVTGKTRFEGKDWYRIAHSGRAAYVFGSLLGQKVTPAVGVYPSLAPGKTFRDCDTCPEMVVIPSGSFRMGDLSGGGYKYEKPVHKVRIGYSFAVGKYEVTRGEFAKFITETGYDAGNSCYVWAGSKWESRSGKSWRDPGYSQTDRDPVACVSWYDVKAYVEWMSRKSGKEYRLLSESEWEYMARAGSTSKYPFGASDTALCQHGNGADQSTSFDWRNKSCNDGVGEKTSPAGSYKANKFGVYDTVGNVWELVEDCWNKNYHGAPIDGSAWTSGGDCSKRVLRGGSWNYAPGYLRSAYRNWNDATTRNSFVGFRIARTLSR